MVVILKTTDELLLTQILAREMKTIAGTRGKRKNPSRTEFCEKKTTWNLVGLVA